MVWKVLDKPPNAAGWLLTVIFTPICILATILRFVATKRSGRKPGWEDFWAVLALVFFIPYVVYMLMLFTMADGLEALDFIRKKPKDWILMAQYGIMMNGLYGLQQTFAKYSLLALYYRIFWVNRGFTITVWGVAAVQGAWGIVVLLCHIFACVPVRKSWYPKVPGTCINMNTFFSVYEPVNSAIDFFMAGMAIYMLWKLSYSRNTPRIWGLSILFALGAFSGIVGIIKTVEAQQSAKRNYLSVIWNLVQMATSIICCCAPMYNSILPETNFFTAFGSWASQTFRSASSRSKSSDSGSAANAAKRTASSPSSKGSDTYHGKGQHNAHWTRRDGSSERELAWAEVEPVYGSGRGVSEDTRPSEKGSYPMRNVKVEHFDMV